MPSHAIPCHAIHPRQIQSTGERNVCTRLETAKAKTATTPRLTRYLSAESSGLSRNSISQNPSDIPPFGYHPHRNMSSVTDKILKGKYPAKEHVKKVVEYMRSKEPGAEGVLYLEAQKTVMIEDNDEAAPFRYVR